MKINIQKQMVQFQKRYQEAAKKAGTPEERAEVLGFWTGFLNAMRITKVISQKEYEHYFEVMFHIFDSVA